LGSLSCRVVKNVRSKYELNPPLLTRAPITFLPMFKKFEDIVVVPEKRIESAKGSIFKR
jgi:hypothetical protein